jgi:hypothetical protein
MTAGLIALLADPSGGKVGLANQTVTLASEGLRHGSAVTMVNEGGQWVNNFDRPAVQVETVGTTVAEVQQEMQTELGKVRDALTQLENQAQIDPNTAISLRNSTSPPPIYYQGGSQIRALAATIALGLIVTLSLRTILRRRLPRTSAAASETPSQTPLDPTLGSPRELVGAAGPVR